MADDVDLQPAASNQELRSAVVAAEAGRWQPARELLAGQADWSRKTGLLTALAAAVPPPLAQAWAGAEPGNPDALNLLARVCLQWAWPAPNAPAWLREPVPAGAGQLLRQAVDAAMSATRLAPDDPTASSPLVLLAAALAEPKDEFWRRLGNTLEVDRWNVEVHEHALLYLSHGWYGSHQELRTFAHDTAAAAPLGSRLHNLPLEAHCDWETAVSKTEGRLAARLAGWRLDRRWVGKPLRAAVDRTMIKWFRIARPAGGGDARSLNVLAYVLVQTERWTEAAEVFQAIGRHQHAYPWERIRPSDPQAVFRAARDHAREHVRDELKD